MGTSRRGSGFTAGARGQAGLPGGGVGNMPAIEPSSSLGNVGGIRIPSMTDTGGLTGQESLGINSIQEPFGGLGSKRGAPAFTASGLGLQDVDKPATRVGLTPGSLGTEETDTITSPGSDPEADEEKRQRAVDKANDYKVSIGL